MRKRQRLVVLLMNFGFSRTEALSAVQSVAQGTTCTTEAIMYAGGAAAVIQHVFKLRHLVKKGEMQ